MFMQQLYEHMKKLKTPNVLIQYLSCTIKWLLEKKLLMGPAWVFYWKAFHNPGLLLSPLGDLPSSSELVKGMTEGFGSFTCACWKKSHEAKVNQHKRLNITRIKYNTLSSDHKFYFPGLIKQVLLRSSVNICFLC